MPQIYPPKKTVRPEKSAYGVDLASRKPGETTYALKVRTLHLLDQRATSLRRTNRYGEAGNAMRQYGTLKREIEGKPSTAASVKGAKKPKVVDVPNSTSYAKYVSKSPVSPGATYDIRKPLPLLTPTTPLEHVRDFSRQMLGVPDQLRRGASDSISQAFGYGKIDPNIYENDPASRISAKAAGLADYVIPGWGQALVFTQGVEIGTSMATEGVRKTASRLVAGANPFAPNLRAEDRILRGIGLVGIIVGGVRGGKSLRTALSDEGAMARAVSARTGTSYQQSLGLVKEIKANVQKGELSAGSRPTPKGGLAPRVTGSPNRTKNAPPPSSGFVREIRTNAPKGSAPAKVGGKKANNPPLTAKLNAGHVFGGRPAHNVDLEQFAIEVLKIDPKENPFRRLSVAPHGKLAQVIMRHTGRDVTHYQFVIDGSRIRHIWREHGPGATAKNLTYRQANLTEADFDIIHQVLANPDRVTYEGSRKGGLPNFSMEKAIGNGYTVRVELRGEQNRKMAVVGLTKLLP